jgi:methylated-DNA-[protein]-cysteine S-methyltransferase
MTGNDTQLIYTRIPSPIGELLLAGDGETLHRLHMLQAPRPTHIPASWRERPQAFAEAKRQLHEYFDGQRERFELPVTMDGTSFQRDVWSALCEIDYGQTASYGEIARRVGKPDAARAVGITNARNPIAIVVPCHRVIGANGTLTGYGGGLERKRYLLDLEQAASQIRLSL